MLGALLVLTPGAHRAAAQQAVTLGQALDLPLRLSPSGIAEGFNGLNRANLQLPNNVYGTGRTPNAGFGLPTAADSPRQIQFGLRLDF